MLRTARLPVATSSLLQYVVLKKAARAGRASVAGRRTPTATDDCFRNSCCSPDLIARLPPHFCAATRWTITPNLSSGRKGMRNTLLVWGDHDTDIRRSHIVRVRDWLPPDDYHELAGAGHGRCFRRLIASTRFWCGTCKWHRAGPEPSLPLEPFGFYRGLICIWAISGLLMLVDFRLFAAWPAEMVVSPKDVCQSPVWLRRCRQAAGSAGATG